MGMEQIHICWHSPNRAWYTGSAAEDLATIRKVSHLITPSHLDLYEEGRVQVL